MLLFKKKKKGDYIYETEILCSTECWFLIMYILCIVICMLILISLLVCII